jgi:choline dehydrogenase-like flavoprotein
MALTVSDPIALGLARGWRVYGGRFEARPERLVVDVCIVGSGAGAGITAAMLTKAGLSVALVEEGPLKSSRDFKMNEADAYPQLYQESAARKTADKAITILQGRAVGGSTTVNWTSSFRTPSDTLAYWQREFGLADYTEAQLTPWFVQAEKRLHISPWTVPPNENNDLLKRGAAKLGIATAAIARNVNGCWNLGYCGMGCPTNAKQSMLVTTIPQALDAGAQLLVETRAQAFEFEQGRVKALLCLTALPNGDTSAAGAAGAQVTRVVAKHYVLAAGAIGSPAVLLRSKAPDPHGLLGTRTFLHPVVMSAATYAQRVEGWKGAPQTIYSDHFLETQPINGQMGYKLEAPPIHPLLFASNMNSFGASHAAAMHDFANSHVLLGLMRDGFHAESVGGRVKLNGDSSPVLDYPLTDFVFDGARRALASMAEIQFAAGARKVTAVHEMCAGYSSWSEAKKAIAELPMRPYATRMVSAHVMGGCGMAGSALQGVVRPDGVHWQIDNLSVHDGSLFPTSIGANPQLSIYGITARLASALAQRLTGKAINLAEAEEFSPPAQSVVSAQSPARLQPLQKLPMPPSAASKPAAARP